MGDNIRSCSYCVDNFKTKEYIFIHNGVWICVYAVKELIWFDRIMDECIFKGPKLVSELFVGNMATIDFMKSPIENH